MYTKDLTDPSKVIANKHQRTVIFFISWLVRFWKNSTHCTYPRLRKNQVKRHLYAVSSKDVSFHFNRE